MGFKELWATPKPRKVVAEGEYDLKLDLFGLIFTTVLVGWSGHAFIDSLLESPREGWGWPVYYAVLTAVVIFFLVFEVKMFRQREDAHYSIAESQGAIDAYGVLLADTLTDGTEVQK